MLSWCTINYYEYSHKVGEQFRASSSRVFVDGYTSPYRNFSSRFSLGLLENVKRQKGVEHVRASIGQGNFKEYSILSAQYARTLIFRYRIIR
jgi:hypothetical protein